MSSVHDPVVMGLELIPNTSFQGRVMTGFLRLSFLLEQSGPQTPNRYNPKDVDAAIFRLTGEINSDTDWAFQFRPTPLYIATISDRILLMIRE